MQGKMKILKSVSLFFLLSIAMFLLGFVSGVKTEHYFYPGESVQISVQRNAAAKGSVAEVEDASVSEPETTAPVFEMTVSENRAPGVTGSSVTEEAITPVSVKEETLSADTEYVLREADLLRGTEVETVWQLPGKYIGMDRERFGASVQNYSDYPPLSELERGFVQAEVVSFARKRVVVRKSYQYIGPDEILYLAVKDNEVVVYLEDRKTIYLDTGIRLEDLPEDVQMQIIQMMPVKSEEELYGFLENYSS